MKPAATLGSMHVCPMCSGTVPHVGGPVMGPGIPTVLINGKPAAVMGDKCTCVGPPDTIIKGNPMVLVDGKPMVCMGDMTAHGGSIVVGEPNILVGSATPLANTYMPIKEIPFPKITLLDILGAAVTGESKNLKQAKENMEKAKNEAKKHGYLPDFVVSG